MIFFTFLLGALIAVLDIFFIAGLGASGRFSFFLVALTLLLINRQARAALILALVSGFLFDLIFPPPTFGFWLVGHGLIYLLMKKLIQLFLSSQPGRASALLAFFGGTVYYTGITLSQGAEFSRAALGSLFTAIIGTSLITGLAAYALRPLYHQRRGWRH